LTLLFDAVHQPRVAVTDEAAPLAVDEQEARVRLGVVAGAELDERFDRTNPLRQVVDDPVVAELGEDAELDVAPRLRIGRTRPRLLAAEQDLDVLDAALDARGPRVLEQQLDDRVAQAPDHAHERLLSTARVNTCPANTARRV
jgi:hypothetical protein